MSRLSRPGIEHYWGSLDGQVPVAWKTGTSYGQKDAWAIGVNRQWTIGVWVGNFTGEGNASASGARSAAPLLFALFGTLTRRGAPMWFDEPHRDLAEVECCKESGYAAGPYCPETTTVKVPRHAYLPRTCPYHKRYLIDRASGRSVCSLCWNGLETEWVTRYIVPPAAREILEESGRRMDTIPLHAAHCPTFGDGGRMELVYPLDGIKIFIPRDFDGEYEKIVLSARHQRPSTHLFWYLNGSLVGETVGTHQYAVDLEPGFYRLTVQDEEGFTRTVRFTAYTKNP
jgi:penicillin-binding protein 1C